MAGLRDSRKAAEAAEVTAFWQVLGLPGLVADRILLGSDFPNIPYPFVHQLQALARLDLGSAWLRLVCHDNAARLLGL